VPFVLALLLKEASLKIFGDQRILKILFKTECIYKGKILISVGKQ